MKKLLLFLLLIPFFVTSQVTVSNVPGVLSYDATYPIAVFMTGDPSQVTYKSGVYKTMPWAYWDNPNTTDIVVVAQGSGEFVTDFSGNYGANGVLSKNSYAATAFTIDYPFDILVAGNYKAPGMSGNPSQTGIINYLSEFISTLPHGKVIGTGYSFGGQLMAGFLTESQNGTKPTEYKGSEIFDAYVIMAGKAPGTPNFNIHKDKPVFIVHGSNDTAVPISNGLSIMNRFNAVTPSHSIYPNYKQTWKGSTMSYAPTTVPDTAYTRMEIIIGGSHGSSWTEGYKWNATSGPGYEVRKFIEWVLTPRYMPIKCESLLDEQAMKATFYLPDGSVVNYNLIKP